MVLAAKQVDGFFKERPQVPVATGADLPEIAIDHVLVLRPDAERFYPGKTVTLAESGEIAVTPYGRAVWFRPLQLPVDGIRSLHAAFTRVAETIDGPGLIVRGQVWKGADPRSITRRKTGRKASRHGNVITKGRPRGLEDAARHWAVLDMDKVPNLLAIDPRVEPERAIAFLRGLLPLSLRDVRMSWQWSSSTCLRDAVGRPLPADQPPETLGVHLRVWLDEPMAEADLRSLLKRANAHVTAELARRGAQNVRGGRYVDSATATYSQPIYTIRPQFEGGAVDPFPGDSRYGLTGDGAPAVNVALLLAELPPPPCSSGRTLTPEERTKRATAREIAQAARQARGTVVEFTPGLRRQTERAASCGVVVPLKGSAAETPWQRHARWLEERYEDGKEWRITDRRRVFMVRALRDIHKLFDDLRSNDAAWEEAGGIPEGMRNDVVYNVARILAHMVPAHKLRTAIQDYFDGWVDMGWYFAEWHMTADAAVVERAMDAAHSLGTWHKGKIVDPRYAPPKKHDLIELLGVSEEQMIWLDLEALISEPVRAARIRRAKGVPTLQERRERERATAEKYTKPWETVGVSESCWYRRKREARAQGVGLPTDETWAGKPRSREAWTAIRWREVAVIVDSKNTAQQQHRSAEEETLDPRQDWRYWLGDDDSVKSSSPGEGFGQIVDISAHLETGKPPPWGLLLTGKWSDPPAVQRECPW